MAEPEIAPVEDRDWPAWDGFLASLPESCFYQSSIWAGALQDGAGFRTIGLIARDRDGVAGVLPLFLVRKPLLGAKAISIPFDMTSGGPRSRTEGVGRALLHAAAGSSRAAGAEYLEIRSRFPSPAAESAGFEERRSFACGAIPLIGAEANRRRLDKSRRQDISRCARAGVILSESRARDDFAEYYEAVLSPHFKSRGSPLFSFRLLDAVVERCAGSAAARAVLVSARLRGKMIGGVILYCFGSTVVLKSLAALPEYWRLGVNAAIGWAGIEYGLRNGFKSLDFGTSEPGMDGQARFKKDLGCDMRDAHAYTLSFGGKPLALERFSSDKTRLARKAWRLLPDAALRPLASMITEWLC